MTDKELLDAIHLLEQKIQAIDASANQYRVELQKLKARLSGRKSVEVRKAATEKRNQAIRREAELRAEEKYCRDKGLINSLAEKYNLSPRTIWNILNRN